MAEIKNAIIKSAIISTEDGFLDAILVLDYGGVGQCFGGYNLYTKTLSREEPGNFAGLWITRCMEIAGVCEWSKMVGKSIRVLADRNHVEAIGHIVEDKWFYPKEEFKKLSGLFFKK